MPLPPLLLDRPPASLAAPPRDIRHASVPSRPTPLFSSLVSTFHHRHSLVETLFVQGASAITLGVTSRNDGRLPAGGEEAGHEPRRAHRPAAHEAGQTHDEEAARGQVEDAGAPRGRAFPVPTRRSVCDTEAAKRSTLARAANRPAAAAAAEPLHFRRRLPLPAPTDCLLPSSLQAKGNGRVLVVPRPKNVPRPGRSAGESFQTSPW